MCYAGSHGALSYVGDPPPFNNYNPGYYGPNYILPANPAPYYPGNPGYPGQPIPWNPQPYNPFQPLPYNPVPAPVQQIPVGWRCPVCGNCYSNFMTMCPQCSITSYQTTTDSIDYFRKIMEKVSNGVDLSQAIISLGSETTKVRNTVREIIEMNTTEEVLYSVDFQFEDSDGNVISHSTEELLEVLDSDLFDHHSRDAERIFLQDMSVPKVVVLPTSRSGISFRFQLYRDA